MMPAASAPLITICFFIGFVQILDFYAGLVCPTAKKVYIPRKSEAMSLNPVMVLGMGGDLGAGKGERRHETAEISAETGTAMLR
jgi:hypothetical protein